MKQFIYLSAIGTLLCVGLTKMATNSPSLSIGQLAVCVIAGIIVGQATKLVANWYNA